MMSSERDSHSPICSGSTNKEDSLQTFQTCLKCLCTSVVVDSNASNNGISPDSNICLSSEDEEAPDPSWFTAATILLSLKTNAEARLKGTHNRMNYSSPIWPPYYSPRNETNNHMKSGVSVNQGNVDHHYDNGYAYKKEENEVDNKMENQESGHASDGEQQNNFEDYDDEIDKDLSTTCTLCHKVYSRPSTLKAHMRIHTGEKPFQCSICDKSFSQDANLKAHLRVHSKEKPFKCQICQRRFAQSSSVTTHMRIHSGERPYKCKVCSRGFADSSTLTKHLRTHTGEKPYQCKLCDTRFSQSGNLSRHMRVHRRKK